MKLHTHADFRGIEQLEERYAPSNVTVSVANHTLYITGDNDANVLTIDGTVGDPTQFKITATGDTINHAGSTFTTASGVTSISVRLLGGSDTIDFSNAVAPTHLLGSLTVNGGDGDNIVKTDKLSVAKSLTLINGNGKDTAALNDLITGGSVVINNGNGGSDTSFNITDSGPWFIGGSLTITNGTGYDALILGGIGVRQNVTITNGHGDAAGNAGFFQIYNRLDYNLILGGNLTVSYLDGEVGGSGLYDVEVGGNVIWKLGTGKATVNVDGYISSSPVVVHGNFTVTGSGEDTVNVGTQYKQTGLLVGKSFSVTLPSGPKTDLITLNKLQVIGATTLTLGNGANVITVDDSNFGGRFSSTTGSGADTFKLETASGGTVGTTFAGPVSIKEGAGVDTLIRAGSHDLGQFIRFAEPFIVHTGGNPGETVSSFSGHEFGFFNLGIVVVP